MITFCVHFKQEKDTESLLHFLNEALDDDERIEMHKKLQEMLNYLHRMAAKRNERRDWYKMTKENVENYMPKDITAIRNKIIEKKNEINRLKAQLAYLEGQ